MALELARYIPWLKPCLTTYAVVTGACFLPAIVLGMYLLFDVRNPQADPVACKKLGSRIQTQLGNQYDKRYSGLEVEQQNGTGSWKVKSLWIYPIKSCTGLALDRGRVIGTGMEYDRQFCFAQLSSTFPTSSTTPQIEKVEHKWKFITQRSIAVMATIKTEVWIPDPHSPTYTATHPNVRSGGVLVIKFPRSNHNLSPWGRLVALLTSIVHPLEHSVQIPFDPTSEQISNSGYTTESMEIWKDSPKSLKMASTENGDTWIEELRFYCGITNHLALFRVSKDDSREVYRCAPRKEELGYQSKVGFQDAYPLHILNLASVHDIGRKLSKDAPPLGALNFRPNIVITGGMPYEEDSWKRIRIGEYEYYVACRTVRCLLPNVNPATGLGHGSEPNKTLKTHRRIDAGDSKNACLGMQMVPAVEDSEIKVGDSVEILETGDHYYIKQ